MAAAAHLWAIGYDATERAEQVQDEVAKLANKKCLILLDSAVAVRYPDGTVTLNGERFMPTISFRTHLIASQTFSGGQAMTTAAHLWAIGYDDVERAVHAREVISKVGWGAGRAGKYLILLDIAVIARHADGSFTYDRKPFPSAVNIFGSTAVGFLAGLVLAAPIIGAAIGALMGAGATASDAIGIPSDFIREVQEMMKPATSALFVLDDRVDMEVILHAIRGLSGTVLKTNVDLEQVRLIQSTLAASPTATTQPDGR